MPVQKLKIPDPISFSELDEHLRNGAKFTVYSYTISIFFAVTLRRLSPAFFITPEDKTNYARKYNNITRFFGFWGIPWGPIFSFKSFETNKKGGIDVTKDILLNIDETSWNNREVEIKTINSHFIKPSSDENKAFNQAFKTLTELKDSELYIGININVADEVDPYFVIGIQSKQPLEYCEPIIRKALAKRFIKNVYFEFYSMDQSEISSFLHKLKEQGEHYILNKLN